MDKAILNKKFLSVAAVVAMSLCLVPLTGCVVAGVSSGRGFFIWPGSIGMLVIVFVLFLLLRRR